MHGEFLYPPKRNSKLKTGAKKGNSIDKPDFRSDPRFAKNDHFPVFGQQPEMRGYPEWHLNLA